MCGITGIFDTRGRRPVDRVLLERMNRTQVHRGPDEDGCYLEPGVGLAHRRLAIIDLSSGQQPMATADGRLVITYNGEIYNFQALAEELRQHGCKFRTRCDTEVVLEAWRVWGEECVTRFNGMFAFAIWDREQELVFLARDRVGINPLYYSVLEDGQLLFGSELKSLMAHPAVDRTISDEAVEEYFAFGYVPEPRSILANTFKLPPGTTLTAVRGQAVPEPRVFWDVPFEPTASSEAAIVDELPGRLRAAVNRRLIADVPLGAFLSGGVDSSSVVAAMADLMDEPVKTCSIAFGEAAYNEADYADQVARSFGTEHVVQEVDPADFSLVDNLAAFYDEPYADSSAIPTYRVCELARRKVTVALSGDGGDENFAGYRRHRWHAWEEVVRGALPDWFRRPVFGALGRIYPKLDWGPRVLRAKSTFQALARDSLAAYLHSVSVVPDGLRTAMYSDSFRRRLQGYDAVEVFRRHAANAPTDHPLSLIQYLDFKTYLVGDILTKVDRASMAHSLEVRVPILDHEFVEWVSGIPPELKLRGREGKYVFKKSLEGSLPDNILYRPKMGFGVPLATWFRGPLREHVRQAVTDPRLLDTGLFDPAALQQLVDQHQSGAREHSAVLWSLVMFRGFLEHLESTKADLAWAKGA